MSLLLIASAYLDAEEELSIETDSNNVIEQEAKAPQNSNSSNGVDCASFEIKSRRSKRRKVGQKPDIPLAQPTLNDCKNVQSSILNLKPCQVKLSKCDGIKTNVARENVGRNKTMKVHKARQGPKSTINETKKKPGKVHLCSFPGCSKSFSRPCRLREHYGTHTGKKPFECKICLKRFNQSTHLRQHARIHTENPTLKCPYCPKQYRYSCSLTRHAKKAHGKVWREKTQVTTSICNENTKQSESSNIEFVKPDNSMKPKEKTTPNKRKQCEAKKPKKVSSCNNSIETKYKMNCSFPNCGKYFPTKQRLKIHNRIHTGEKPYECKVCFKRFNQTCALTIHERIHTGDQPFECKICYKRFRQRPNLTIHLQNHQKNKISVVKKKRGNGTRRKNCKQTEQISTSSKTNAKTVKKSTREEKAMKKLRPGRNPKSNEIYTCLVCPERCRTMDSIQLHITNAHGIELSAKFDKNLLLLGSSK